MDYRTMYFQLAAKVADALDILLKAQQEGEMQFSATIRKGEGLPIKGPWPAVPRDSLKTRTARSRF